MSIDIHYSKLTNSHKKKIILFFIIVICLFFVNLIFNHHEQNSILKNNNYFIAHAGGQIHNHNYTNSKEALIQSLNNGYKYIELDLALTKDSILVCVHEWKQFNIITGSDSLHFIPTIEEFKKRKIHNSLSPITFKEALNLKDRHSYIIVTDKISDPNILNKYVPNIEKRNEIMVEAFSLKDYYNLKKHKYIPMLSLYKMSFQDIFNISLLNFKDSNPIEWIVVPNINKYSTSNITPTKLSILKFLTMGKVKVAMYSSNDSIFFKKHLGKSIDLIYTDNHKFNF